MNTPAGTFDLRGKWTPSRVMKTPQGDQRRYMREIGHICEHDYMPRSCPKCTKENK